MERVFPYLLHELITRRLLDAWGDCTRSKIINVSDVRLNSRKKSSENANFSVLSAHLLMLCLGHPSLQHKQWKVWEQRDIYDQWSFRWIQVDIEAVAPSACPRTQSGTSFHLLCLSPLHLTQLWWILWRHEIEWAKDSRKEREIRIFRALFPRVQSHVGHVDDLGPGAVTSGVEQPSCDKFMEKIWKQRAIYYNHTHRLSFSVRELVHVRHFIRRHCMPSSLQWIT